MLEFRLWANYTKPQGPLDLILGWIEIQESASRGSIGDCLAYIDRVGDRMRELGATEFEVRANVEVRIKV